MTVAPEKQTLAAATAPERTSPYQGLVPYGEADAEWFFGREESRDVVLDSLRAYRVTVLYGESGVGKSSLLRASVLPYLKASPDVLAVVFSDWSVDDPLAGLKEALGSDGEVYVILDQFEEFFLYHGADEAGEAFEKELVSAIRRRGSTASFVLSIREDALAKLDRLQNRIPTLLDNLVRLEHLDERAAREAIQRPLDHWNAVHSAQVSIESALVDEVIAQLEGGRLLVGGDDAAGGMDGSVREGRIEAPYLQLVLARIWDEDTRAGSSVLRLATLERLGGAEHIVRTHLDGVLAGFSRRERKIAARVFRYLVTPSGTKIAHRPEDLAAYTGVPLEKLTPVLGGLAGEARILRPTANGAYEIYHDVLAAAVLDWRRRYEEARSRGLLGQWAVLSFATAVVAVMIVAYLGHLFGGLENRTMDARFSIRGGHVPSNVMVVGIDNASLQRLGQWPFRRSLHGRVIDRLRRAGAEAIAFDIQFTEPSTPKEDNALILSVRRARNVVLGTTEVDEQGKTTVFGGGPGLRFSRARVGNTTLAQSSDKKIRSVSWGSGQVDPVTGKPGPKLESFGLVAAEIATGRPIPRSAVGGASGDINFAGPGGTVPAVPYWKVLDGRFKPGTFANKIVVVGATAPSLQDVHATPAGSAPMSGPELQANIARTALQDFPLRRHELLDMLLIALLGFVVPVASLRFGWKVYLPIGLAASALYVLLVQLAFNNDLRLPFVYPLLALVLTTLFTLGWSLRPRPRG